MLSDNAKKIGELIETKLLSPIKDEGLLYHYSVERKLKAVEIFYQNASDIFFTDFIQTAQTASTTGSSGNFVIDPESTFNRISAYIDAFFMSAKSTMDAFAHELRMLYDFRGHVGDIYFENALDLIRAHHTSSELNLYIDPLNIRGSQWYTDLNSYRKASAHESIIPIRPVVVYDILSGQMQFREASLKLPIDPTQKPHIYNGKNFTETGRLIKEQLHTFIVNCYEKIFIDINSNRTVIVL